MIINILTRTHRENYFKVCKQSIESQTYKDINWIVGSDRDCPYYPQAVSLIKDYRQPVSIPQGMYYAPWNKYLEQLNAMVTDGWIIYIDDDDCFTSPKSVQRIAAAIENDNQMIVWKVKIKDNWVVPSHSFSRYIAAGDFSGIGFAFHSKHLPVEWGYLSYGDFRVANQLIQKGLKIKWVDMILTQTQKGANNGNN